MRDEKYKQIMDLAEWVNTNRFDVAGDGMSVIIAIADTEKIRRLACTGGKMEIGTMMGAIMEGIYNDTNQMNLVKN